MFLIERLIGVGVYMSILLVACWFLSFTMAKTRSVLIWYLVALCVMAAFYKPYETGDLYRTYILMDFFRTMSFVEFWSGYAIVSSAPAARLLFWIIAKTEMFSLLPVISSFICYSLIFRTVCKAQRCFSISNETIATVLFFVMSASIYISVIGGIRMMLAFSLLMFSFYRGAAEKKMNLMDLLISSIAILMHATAIVVFVMCAITLIFASHQKPFRKALATIFVIALGTAFIVAFPSTVLELFEKASGYIFGDQYSDKWEYIMGFLIILLLFLILCEYRKLDQSDKVAVLKPFNVITVLCMLVSVVLFFEFSIFYRFGAHFAVLFAIPTMMVTLEKTKGKPSAIFKRIDVRSVMVVFCVFIALLSCARGSLSSLKFFEL